MKNGRIRACLPPLGFPLSLMLPKAWIFRGENDNRTGWKRKGMGTGVEGIVEGDISV